MKTVSYEEHLARVRQLRKLGYRVKTIKLPNGQSLVLTSKQRFVCRAHHCTARRDKGGAPAVPWPKQRKR
jgi:hypothetical protein